MNQILADFSWTLRVTPVPTDVWSQRDARVRCPEDPRNWLSQNQFPPSWTPATMIDQHWDYSFYEAATPNVLGLDVRYARFEREVAYAYNLAAATGDPNIFFKTGWFDHRLLFTTKSIIHPTDCPFQSDAGGNDIAEEQSYMPNVWRSWEHTTRYKFGVFANVQHREVYELRPEIRRAVYPSVFSDFSRRYEVPFDLRPQPPPIVNYKGVELVMSSPLWKVLFTEHSWIIAAELVHQAHRGRLFYIPQAHIEDPQLELKGILREVELIRWDLAPRRASLVPKNNFHLTPVYLSGDLVDFDRDAWGTQLPNEMYIDEDDGGRPKEPKADRGPIQTDRLNGQVPGAVPHIAHVFNLADPHIGTEFDTPTEIGRTPVGSSVDNTPFNFGVQMRTTTVNTRDAQSSVDPATVAAIALRSAFDGLRVTHHLMVRGMIRDSSELTCTPVAEITRELLASAEVARRVRGMPTGGAPRA